MADVSEVRVWVERLQYVKREQAKLKEIELQAREELLAALGEDFEGEGELDGRIVFEYKRRVQRKVDLKALRAKFPEVVEQFVYASESRALMVKDGDS